MRSRPMANGKVEGMVGYRRCAFMAPLPRARDFAELNAMLLERCKARLIPPRKNGRGQAAMRSMSAGERRPVPECRRREL